MTSARTRIIRHVMTHRPSGHVYRYDGRRGAAWTRRGRPHASYLTKRMAQDWLDDVLGQARAGTLPGMTRTGVTFAEACEDYLAHKESDRRLKPTTLRDYSSIMKAHLIPAFGDLAIENLTTEMVEDWKLTLQMSNTTKIKILTVLFGVMERARKRYRLPVNPIRDVEKPRHDSAPGGELQFYSPEEVFALVRAAESEQDAAVFLTAAFTGLRRGELVALRWRDVDFPNATIRVSASYSERHLTRPKSGKVRAVPMAPDVATALARLGQRERWTGPDDLVFPGATGSWMDASAMYRRFVAAAERAGLSRLRFHDLRHTFGTTMAANPKVDLRRLQEWMGHADMTTTQRYSHFTPRHDDAALVAEAFALNAVAERSAPRSTA